MRTPREGAAELVARAAPCEQPRLVGQRRQVGRRLLAAAQSVPRVLLE
ncbi:MAG TPA: hypothetical protein VH083_00090 [Myxococcales bacterium]|nr:hypothetical protein [Myxococcales bacterium]